MASPAPQEIRISKKQWKAVNDSTCGVMCPECYVKTSVTGVINDEARYGCSKCGLVFSIQWYNASWRG